MRWKPRIQTILLSANIVMLAILLSGLSILKLFETALIRQTEMELNIQAVFVESLYTQSYERVLGTDSNTPLRAHESEVNWQPLKPTLNMAKNAILDEEPKALSIDATHIAHHGMGMEISPIEIQAGRSIVRSLQHAQRQTLSSIRIVNKSGIVISSTNLVDSVSLSNRPEVIAALNGDHQAIVRRRTLTQEDPSAFSISRRADYRVHVVHPIFYENEVIAAVVLSRTPESLSQLLERYKSQILIYVGILLLLVWLLSTFSSFTIHRPIVALMRQAKRATRGEKGAVIPLKNPVSYEVMELSNSVATMAKTLEDRADYLLKFASHVSHEFKTPVTAIQGAIELLIDHREGMTEERQKKFLINLQDDAFRLEKLVYRLLDFAKADLGTSAIGTINPNDILDKVVKTCFQKRYADTKINLSYNKDNTSNNMENIKIHPESFESIITNLIENAIQANAKTINIVSEHIGHIYKLTIADDGDPISEANQLKIFEPFFTLHRSSGGTGLGLSIIGSLLKTCGGRIHLAHEEKWKRFSIEIPTHNAK